MPLITRQRPFRKKDKLALSFYSLLGLGGVALLVWMFFFGPGVWAFSVFWRPVAMLFVIAMEPSAEIDESCNAVAQFCQQYISTQAAIASAVFSLVSVILLAQTLRSARKSTEVTTSIGRSQVRAYLLLDQSCLEASSQSSNNILLTVRNYGESPADEVSYWARTEWLRGDAFTIIRDHIQPGISAPVFPTNGESKFEVELAKQPEVQSDARLYLYGEISYRDVFGVRGFSHFSFVAQDAGAPSAWQATSFGNWFEFEP